MLQRTIPGTDLSVSVVGFGCWASGGLWWGDDVDDGDSKRAIVQALDLGINLFDTAPLYGHGHADRVLVEALGARRHEAIIATKVGVRWDGEGAHARSDLSAAWLREDTEASLQRLGVERIDLLQVHWPCQAGTPLEETMATLHALRSEGKIRTIGLSNYNAGGMREAASHGNIDILQTPYSILRREFEHELAPLCADFPSRPADDGSTGAARPLGVLAYEPLCRGMLTGKYGPRVNFPESDLRARDERFTGPRYLRALTIISRLGLLARRLDVPVAAIAIAWVLRNPVVTSALVGAKRADQVIANVRAAELLEREDIWPEVDRIVAAWRG